MDYPNIPYTSLPFAYTQPGALAALAMLYGLSPSPADKAAVLELGCASGGNIIPLAARFQGATFVGFDISSEDIALGSKRIQALGLPNVSLEAADAVEFAERAQNRQRFDYIICHGLLSWAPEPVRRAVFRICSEQLSDNGVAVVSFNVRPGWHAQHIIRDIVMRGVDPAAQPFVRAEQAVALLRKLAPKLASSPYGMIIQQGAERLAALPPSYLLWEHLAPINEAFFFDDVVRDAGSHGLHYVTEGELAMAAAESMAPQAADLVRELSGGDRLMAQSWLDAISGRIFRRAVFAKRPSGEAPSAGALKHLHVLGALQPTDSRRAYRIESGHVVNAPDDAIARAFAEIGEAFPASVPIARLGGGGTMAAILLQLAQAGALRLSSVPVVVGRQTDSAPRAFNVSRLEAAQRQGWVTTLLHRSCNLTPDLADVLIALDGKDRKTLSAIFGEARLGAALAQFEREALLAP
ncbi:MAG: methyltransferase domain-containing protein [Proteobacteria bacterium]|nr:methyltransferase domain-containing protein [Pseudomonadota bacterium]